MKFLTTCLLALTIGSLQAKTFDLFLDKAGNVSTTKTDGDLQEISLDNEAIIDIDEEKSTVGITDLENTIEIKVEKSKLQETLKQLTENFERAKKEGSEVSIKASKADFTLKEQVLSNE